VPEAIKIAACQMPEIREDVDTALSWIDDCAEKAAADDVRLLAGETLFEAGNSYPIFSYLPQADK